MLPAFFKGITSFMKIFSLPYLIFVGISFLSCKNESRNSYLIRDFNKSLQPYLIKIVSKGIVGYDTATRFIEKQATDEELKKLSKSEHPVLRAVAFRAMLHRSTFNHFNVIMNNLDDTAIVATDAGEWGLRYLRVSDDLLENATWEDTLAKNKTIEELITKHNYLSSAYTKLLHIQPKKEYYAYIKEMAQRKRDLDEEFDEMAFYKIECALYALAKFKKNEDVQIIKEVLLSRFSRLSTVSFNLMREYPKEAYLEVYKKLYPGNFYYRICEDRSVDNAVSFVKSLAVYKNEQSGQILKSILNTIPFIRCPADTSYLKEELIYAIRNNQCDAYSKMRRGIESSVKDYEKNKIEGLSVEPVKFPPDTSAEPIRW